MMNSLVGYGVSSESEDEEEVTEENKSKEMKSHNFLLESGSASSESGSESERDEDQDEEHAPPSVHLSSERPLPPTAGTSASNKLPPPSLGGFCVPPSSSVFTNPFKERAEQSLSALQKHVPLTSHTRPTHIAGKKVCAAYRKDGRCRFGIRCKFAHDSDLQQKVGDAAVSETDSHDAATHTPACRETTGERNGEEEEEEEDQSRRKKHRVGVSDSLIPPKRALKQFAMQRNDFTHTHMKDRRKK